MSLIPDLSFGSLVLKLKVDVLFDKESPSNLFDLVDRRFPELYSICI